MHVLLQSLRIFTFGINTEFDADFEFDENKIFYLIIYTLVHTIRYSGHIAVLQGDLDQLVQGQKLLAAKLEAMEAALRYNNCS